LVKGYLLPDLAYYLAAAGSILKIACARPVGCIVFLREQHKKMLNQLVSDKNFYKFFSHAAVGNVRKGLEFFN